MLDIKVKLGDIEIDLRKMELSDYTNKWIDEHILKVMFNTQHHTDDELLTWYRDTGYILKDGNMALIFDKYDNFEVLTSKLYKWNQKEKNNNKLATLDNKEFNLWRMLSNYTALGLTDKVFPASDIDNSLSGLFLTVTHFGILYISNNKFKLEMFIGSSSLKSLWRRAY